MTFAEKLCLSAAFIYLMVGLITGIWKYLCMRSSPKARAPYYVDIAHRASLMYSFAALVLGELAHRSVFSSQINALAVSLTLGYFGLAIISYVIHGWLNDTNNQLRRPHRLGSAELPTWMISVFMWSLIVAEVGGTVVVGTGAMLRIWGG
jgi:hypothetical protein